MLSTQLQSAIIDFTSRVSSRHQERRNYIGLSSIGECERVIYDIYTHGVPHSTRERLKDAMGYALEEALVARLIEMGLYRAANPIVLYDGLVQGHPDGEVEGDLLEIKTIECAKWLPEPPRLPNRVFFQVQAYMHFAGYQRAHVLYLARDTGEMRVIGVSHSDTVAEKINAKLDRLVAAVKTGQRPACSCGYCQGSNGGRP
jgi:hypothetical protein